MGSTGKSAEAKGSKDAKGSKSGSKDAKGSKGSDKRWRMCYRKEIMEAPKRDCVYDAAYTWSRTQCTPLPMGNECCECKNIQEPNGKSDGKGSKDSKGMSKSGSKDSKGQMKDSKQAKGSNDKQDSKSAKASKEAQTDSKSAKSSQDQDQTQSKGAKDGEQGEEQDDSTTAKGKEGKKSFSHGNRSPGQALEEEVETEMANDSMNWMEIVAASAIAIVVTASVIALVMRTKQRSAANQMETEMGAVTHVPDMSTSQPTAEVSA